MFEVNGSVFKPWNKCLEEINGEDKSNFWKLSERSEVADD